MLSEIDDTLHVERNIDNFLGLINVAGKCVPYVKNVSMLQRLLAACVMFLVFSALSTAPPTYAANPKLFTLSPADQSKGLTPEQTQRIDKIKQRKTTASVTVMNTDINTLKGDSISLPLPSGKVLDFSKRNVETRSTDDFTWAGMLSDAQGNATFVVHDGNITGTVTDHGKLYHVEPLGNGKHVLIEVDTSRFPPDDSSTLNGAAGGSHAAFNSATPSDIVAAAQPIGIDVAVAYTPSARMAVPDISAVIQLAVAETNQSYQNSGINIKINLVDIFEIPYSEAGKNLRTILADFAGMSDVRNRRDHSAADMTVLIVNQPNDPEAIGLATTILADSSNAFAVVHYNAATGYYTFAHELGHLQGALHDERTDSSTWPFAYAHGYQHPAASANQRFRTIMAYRCPAQENCEPRIQYWSNPTIAYNGVPTGTATTNDNARVLNETASTVAAFRAPAPGDLHGIVHLQNIGDQPLVGDEWAGTKAQFRRLEGFSIAFSNPITGLSFEYMCHLQDLGDQLWMPEGSFCGTRGQALRLEGFAIHLTGQNADKYDVYYSCHLQDIGDTGPYMNGQFCGTRAQFRRLEAMEVWITPKSNVGLQGIVNLQDIGDVPFQQNTFAGTRAQARRIEGFSIAISPTVPNLGIEYMCHLQDLGDQPWRTDGQFCGTRGQSLRLEGMAVRLTGQAAANYDVYYLCNIQDIGDTGVKKNGDFCGTRAQFLRLEGFYIWVAPKNPLAG